MLRGIAAVRCATNDRGASIMIKAFAATTRCYPVVGFAHIVPRPIYPIDRAEILAGAQFDFKVEFPDRVDPAKLKVTVNGDGLFHRVRPELEASSIAKTARTSRR